MMGCRKNENSQPLVNNLSRSAVYEGKKCEQAVVMTALSVRPLFPPWLTFRNDCPIFVIVTWKAA